MIIQPFLASIPVRLSLFRPGRFLHVPAAPLLRGLRGGDLPARIGPAPRTRSCRRSLKRASRNCSRPATRRRSCAFPDWCGATCRPLGRVVQVGLQHLQWPKSENIEAVQTRARHEIVAHGKRPGVLEVIVGIAPLLGLLGAVSGLVTVFANFGETSVVLSPIRAASRRAFPRRSAPRWSAWPSAIPTPHRLQLFFKKNRGNGRRNGISDRRRYLLHVRPSLGHPACSLGDRRKGRGTIANVEAD